MIDFNKEIDLSNIVCHSGGASGSDTYFSEIGKLFGVKTNAYSYKTSYHNSDDKVEISEEDYQEGVIEVTKANKILNRYGIDRFMNLLARNWAQVKYSEEVFAIGSIIKPGEKGARGFYNKSKFEVIDGGTGYACCMAIINNKPVYVFDQNKNKWFRWSFISNSFIEMKDDPVISCQNFAGIGTREIKPNGILAIENLYKKTFDKFDI